MADEHDHSENISTMINQDSILSKTPLYTESEEVNDNNYPISSDVNEENNNIGDENLTTTNGYTGPYSDPDIRKDGNCASNGEQKKIKETEESFNKKKKGVDIVLYNRNALTKLASTYKLEMFDKNLLVIYNFINVDGYAKRDGTVQDADELENTFKMYGFEVEREGNEDLTCKELLGKLDKFDKRDFTEYGCVAIAVLTHGTWDGWLMAKDGHFSENEIINRLKARTKPSLVTKPVVLIIQACRGTNSTKGVRVKPKSNVQIYRDQTEETHHYYLPVEADMLVIHSSYIGKPSYRPENGTWFIQTLCKKIRELSATEDLESIMVEVKREVAINKDKIINKSRVESGGQYGDVEFHKQVPTVTSTLIRKLYLKNKNDVPFFINNGNAILKDLTPIIDNNNHMILHGKGSDECACLLNILDYFTNLLRIYAAENAYDTQASCILKQTNNVTHRDLSIVKFHVVAISNFLKLKYQQKSHNKFIYWYGEDLPPESQNISVDGEQIEEPNSTCTGAGAGAPLIGAQTILVAVKKFKMNYAPSILVGIGTYTAIHVAHNFFKKLSEK